MYIYILFTYLLLYFTTNERNKAYIITQAKFSGNYMKATAPEDTKFGM